MLTQDDILKAKYLIEDKFNETFDICALSENKFLLTTIDGKVEFSFDDTDNYDLNIQDADEEVFMRFTRFFEDFKKHKPELLQLLGIKYGN